MSFFKRHPLPVFFMLAYLLPWAVWGTTIAQSRGLISFHIPQPLAFWLGLTIATYLSAALTVTALLGLLAVGAHLALGGTHQVGVVPEPAVLDADRVYAFTHGAVK